MAGLSVRSVLVTGANRGIGLELVKQLLAKPEPPQWVFATCRDPEGARAQALRDLLSKHPNLVMEKLDTVSPASIGEAVRKVEACLAGSGLTLLINNAGVFHHVSLEATEPEDMLGAYRTNVVGPLLVSQAFLPLLKKAARERPGPGLSCSRAAIVNMSSEAGSIQNILMWDKGQLIPYRCSKAALNMLTRCQALSCAAEGILCTAIHPGWVKTDMGTKQAPLLVDESVRGLLSVLPTLREEHSGHFLSWTGQRIPW